jgi:ornithine cyclodeaminase/alanine dehydrogenase-like protein (mu-crystallin family)
MAAMCRRAIIITCATLAQEPLIRGAWLRPGTHLDLVGGFAPEMREAGDIVQPLRSGHLTRERILGPRPRQSPGPARR